MIEAAIRARLLATAAVTEQIGAGTKARLWPVHLPQRERPEWPAITYQVISGQPEYDMRRAAGVAEMRLQIDVWSAERDGVRAYDEVRTLAEAVRRSLSGYHGTLDGTGYAVQSCMMQVRRVLYDDGAQIYRESQDWMIGHAEA